MVKALSGFENGWVRKHKQAKVHMKEDTNFEFVDREDRHHSVEGVRLLIELKEHHFVDQVCYGKKQKS